MLRQAAGAFRALKCRVPRAWRERAKAVLGRGPARSYVERRALELDQIVPRDAKIEQLAEGFGFTEGPVWIPDGYLLFADLPHNVIRRWDPRHGASVVRTRTGYAAADIPPGRSMGSNGMTLDGEGRLTICEPGNHRVTRQEPDGRLTVLADRFEGERLNSPNDLVYKSDGALYFTDPPHGLPLEDDDPAKELPFNGVFRLADGKLTLVTAELRRPNGLAFSPDEKYLYVSNSDRNNKIWMRYDVERDGSLANGKLFLDLNGEPGQEPDGMKVDRRGNLYLTGPGGLWITDPAGRILGVIRTTHEPANAAWGYADGKGLYLTARGALYRIRLSIEGIRPLPSQ
jgi:gluconolactonase